MKQAIYGSNLREYVYENSLGINDTDDIRTNSFINI